MTRAFHKCGKDQQEFHRPPSWVGSWCGRVLARPINGIASERATRGNKTAFGSKRQNLVSCGPPSCPVVLPGVLWYSCCPVVFFGVLWPSDRGPKPGSSSFLHNPPVSFADVCPPSPRRAQIELKTLQKRPWAGSPRSNAGLRR